MLGMDAEYILGAAYLPFCAVAGVQIFQYVRQRCPDQLATFHFTFLLLCFIWTAFRVVFWLSGSGWPPWLLYTLYWLPAFIQFSTFSLVVVFFAQGVHWRDWDAHKRLFYRVCFSVDALVLALVVTWIVVSSFQPSCRLEPRLWAIFGALSGLCYLALLVTGAVFGSKVVMLFNSTKLPVTLRSTRSRFIVVVVTSLMLAVLGTRCAFDLYCAANYRTEGFPGDEAVCKTVTHLVVAQLVFWELLPVATLLVYFWVINSSAANDHASDSTEWFPPAYGNTGTQWKSQSSQHGPSSGRPQYGGPQGAGGITGLRGEKEPLLGKMDASKIFSNPSRYDSDDEEQTLKLSRSASNPTSLAISSYPTYGSLARQAAKAGQETEQGIRASER